MVELGKKEDEKLKLEWLTKKMMGEMSEEDKALDFVRRKLFWSWNDTHLKTLRMWINKELERRRERREHPWETRYR